MYFLVLNLFEIHYIKSKLETLCQEKGFSVSLSPQDGMPIGNYSLFYYTEDAFGQKSNYTQNISVVDTIVDINAIETKLERKIEIEASDLKSLLYSWLEEIIILTITDGFVTRKFNVNITKNSTYHLSAKLSGEEINFERHHFKLEIKAPTYHLMEIKVY